MLLPFHLVSSVLAKKALHTPRMGPEGLPVHYEEHVTVAALIQKPGQVEGDSAEYLSSVSLLIPHLIL